MMDVLIRAVIFALTISCCVSANPVISMSWMRYDHPNNLLNTWLYESDAPDKFLCSLLSLDGPYQNVTWVSLVGNLNMFDTPCFVSKNVTLLCSSNTTITCPGLSPFVCFKILAPSNVTFIGCSFLGQGIDAEGIDTVDGKANIDITLLE
eukprot:PhF_6_TR12905/c0_g2_i1/m.20334